MTFFFFLPLACLPFLIDKGITLHLNELMHAVLLGENIKVNPASELVLCIGYEICFFASPTGTIV